MSVFFDPFCSLANEPFGQNFGSGLSAGGDAGLYPDTENLLAWYRTDIIDSKLQAYLPPSSHTTQQVKSSGFTGEGSATVTGLLTTDVISCTGSLPPTCLVDGAMGFAADFDGWDIYVHRAGVLWAYLPGINVGQATELDASGNGHHLTALTGTTISERLDGSGTNYANEAGFSDGPELPHPAGYVFAGGLASSGFLGSSPISSNKTLIQTTLARRIRQDGQVYQVVVNCASAGGDIQFKAFRKTGAVYNMVGESEVRAMVSGVNTFTLTQPFDCRPGDYIGTYFPTANIYASANTDGAASIVYTTGDVDSGEFSSSVANLALDIEFRVKTPFMVVSGDSIAEGHNEGTWDGLYTGPAGDIDAEIMHRLSVSIASDGVSFGNYQNWADGSKDWWFVSETAITPALATGAKNVFIHVGINDIAVGRTLGQVTAYMDNVASLVASAGATLFLDEILPWTGGTDAQAAVIREWNAYYAEWCDANDAILIRCHDRMGQIRPSTGEIDDLKTEFNHDGIHLTKLGVNEMAEIWKIALYEQYATDNTFRMPADVYIPTQFPGPLGIDATVTAGTAYPDITIQAPLGAEFQAIPEFTGEAVVDPATLAPTVKIRIGDMGMTVYSTDLDAVGILRADKVVGA